MNYEKMFPCVHTVALVEGVAELVDSGRNLKPLQQNLSLSLETNVLGPTNKASKVSGGLNITSNTEVSWSLLKDSSLLVVNPFLLLDDTLGGGLGTGSRGGLLGGGFLRTRLKSEVRI